MTHRPTGRPIKDHFVQKDCYYKQDRSYVKRNIKVMLTGGRAAFYLQSATQSIKIFDISRIRHDSMKLIMEEFNKLKESF